MMNLGTTQLGEKRTVGVRYAIYLGKGGRRCLLLGVFMLIALVSGACQAQPTPTPPSAALEQARIVFASNRDGNGEIYVMDADGSNLTRLTNNPAEDRVPMWSPGVDRIVFTSNRDNLYTLPRSLL